MLEFIQEFLPSILAGLLPSLLVFGQSLFVLLKNLKVNHSFTEIQSTINDLKQGNLNVKDITDKAVPELQALTKDFIKEFDVIKKDLIEGLNKDLKELKEELNKKIEEQEALYQIQIKHIRSETKKLKTGGDPNDVQGL